MMEQMPPINPIVPLPPTAIEVVPELAVLRDRIDMIVDYLKWIEKLVSVCIVVVVYAVLSKSLAMLVYPCVYDDVTQVSI
jgi:hypothetical protein